MIGFLGLVARFAVHLVAERRSGELAINGSFVPRIIVADPTSPRLVIVPSSAVSWLEGSANN